MQGHQGGDLQQGGCEAADQLHGQRRGEGEEHIRKGGRVSPGEDQLRIGVCDSESQ